VPVPSPVLLSLPSARSPLRCVSLRSCRRAPKLAVAAVRTRSPSSKSANEVGRLTRTAPGGDHSYICIAGGSSSGVTPSSGGVKKLALLVPEPSCAWANTASASRQVPSALKLACG
jgi:hypothetical protein